MTPGGRVYSEIRILGSIFRFALWPLRDMDPEEALEAFGEECPKADHYPYAYVYGNRKRCSDDGEPKGAAGLCYLSLLESRGAEECLLICARYFGGSKLGLGRLKKVFRDGALEVLEKAKWLRIEEAEWFEAFVPYERLSAVESLFHAKGVSYQKEEGEEGARLVFCGLGSNIVLALMDSGVALKSLGPRKAYLDA